MTGYAQMSSLSNCLARHAQAHMFFGHSQRHESVLPEQRGRIVHLALGLYWQR